MNINQAQACMSAIMGAGFNAFAKKLPDDSWVVTAQSSLPNIPIGDANALAVSQGVVGKISSIEYS